ncbi:class I SAM-dependent methyltransferase [Candidatus Parcubacteria bacterium]|nr:class I SAM-dependent methyltransferase [Candidatus Parcubacteria bacterium]
MQVMHVSEYHKIAAFQAKHWWFFGRKLFLRQFLARYVPGRDAEILDVGCGTGEAILFAARLGYHRVRGLDNAEVAVSFCRKQGLLAVERGDAARLSYAAASFDAVLCLDVLEHVQDDAAVIAEIWRVLRPGGCVFITVPAFRFLWSRHDEVLQHFRRYMMADLLELAHVKPWRIRARSYFFFFIFPLVVAYRWVKRFDRRPRTSDLDLVPEPFNAALQGASMVEVLFTRIFGRLPFGTSLYIVLEKLP